MAKPELRPEHFLPQKLAAAALAVTVVHFDRKYRPLLPASAVRRERGRVLVHVRSAIDRLVADAAASALARAGQPDAALSGPTSLERLRSVKAEREALELAARRGELVAVAEVEQRDAAAVSEWGQFLRGVRRTLASRFGREAAAILDDQLARLRQELTDAIEMDGPRVAAQNDRGSLAKKGINDGSNGNDSGATARRKLAARASGQDRRRGADRAAGDHR